MLGTWRCHADFQDVLVRELKSRWTSDRSRIEFYSDVLDAAWHLDLDPARPIVAPHYSGEGRPSHQSPEVLRSLILMTCAGQTSIPRWHKQLLGEPILAIACGFSPGKIAAPASFYYLCGLLWPDETGPVVRRTKKAPRKMPKSDDGKLPLKNSGVLQRLFAQAQEGRRFHLRPERFLQELMARVVVDESARRQLLGNPEQLAVSMDGSPLETGASAYGKRICTCETLRCSCPRRIEDAYANRGWDSFHKRYFYGYTLYHVTASDSFHDLPIYVRLTQGSRHDSVTGFVSLVEALDLYPHFTFRKLMADSAHDNAPTYQYCYAHHMAPYIDFNSRVQGKSFLESPIGFTSDGAPICSVGCTMLSHGYNPGRRRHKWRCPRESGECACSPSAYGRVVYTYPNGSLREPPVSRDSDAWKTAYKRRTTVERSLKRTLVDRALESCRVRRKHHWYWRATLAAMAHHIDAWVWQARQQRGPMAWLKAAMADTA